MTRRTSLQKMPAAPSRRRVIALAGPLALGLALPARRGLAASGDDLPRLSLAGVELPSVAVDPADVAFTVTVDFAGDQPLASYVTARPRGMPALQRTAAGTWVAWDEQPASLVDNRFAASGGRLSFAVAGGDFSQQSFPVEISIAYRTAAGVKFGVFTMVAKP